MFHFQNVMYIHHVVLGISNTRKNRGLGIKTSVLNHSVYISLDEFAKIAEFESSNSTLDFFRQRISNQDG